MKIWIMSFLALFVSLCFLCGCSFLFTPTRPSPEELLEQWETADTTTTTITTTASVFSTTTVPSLTRDEANVMRPDYDFGSCRQLSGDVAVVLFYMEDFESEWTEEEVAAFTKEAIQPALDFLQREAARYGVSLSMRVAKTFSDLYYDDEVIPSSREGLVTIDVLDQAARELNYSSQHDMLRALRIATGTDEVVCLTLFNKKGNGYGINPKRESDLSIVEHGLLFSYDRLAGQPYAEQASAVALYVLYLYGAEDLSNDTGREQLARLYYPQDLTIMAAYDIADNRVTPPTAFYVGWLNQPTDVMLSKNW